GQGDGRQAQGRRQDRRIPYLSRRTARLPCRLPAELSQGGGRGRLGRTDQVVQEIQRDRLSGPKTTTAARRLRRRARILGPRRHAAAAVTSAIKGREMSCVRLLSHWS